jgi:uncharacterized protein (DUF697 family)
MTRDEHARRILKKYAIASGGAGLITAPFASTAALSALHLALIHELAKLYRVEFSKHTARGIVVALGAAFLPGWLGGGLQRRVLERLPFVTSVVGWVAMAGLSAAVTYGLGRVLIQHFESGGTLLDFDVKHLHFAIKNVFRSAQAAAPRPASARTA